MRGLVARDLFGGSQSWCRATYPRLLAAFDARGCGLPRAPGCSRRRRRRYSVRLMPGWWTIGGRWSLACSVEIPTDDQVFDATATCTAWTCRRNAYGNDCWL
jgi:hypothetical protein